MEVEDRRRDDNICRRCDRASVCGHPFEQFAGLRFTVIMLRMGKLLADLGLVPPGFAYDNLVSQALERVLA